MSRASGTRLGPYEIRTKLGEGGMGEVYLAEDTRLRRRVALKVLPEHLAGDHDRLVRFEREAFAASALNHPNILTIFEFSAVDNTHFLVAEFVDGLSLRQRLSSGQLEKAFAEKDAYLGRMSVDPFMDPLRDDPR